MSKVISIFTISAIAFAIAGCNSSNQKNKAKNEPYKIGIIAALTGSAAQYGQWMKNGIDLAKDDINSNGGINGHQIELVYEDDKTDAQIAVTAMNKLEITTSPQVIIAALTSKSTLAVSPIAERKKTILMAVCASSPDITNSGDYIFRNWPSDNEEGRLMAEYAYNTLGYKKITVLTINNDYGLGLKKVFTKKFIELGGNVVSTEEFPENTTDFRNIITKLKSQTFDAIYMPSHAKEVASFLKQTKQNNINFKVLGCVAYESPELIDIAGIAAEGVIFTTPAFYPDAPDSTVRNFCSAYQKRFNSKPENFAAHGYDALMIIAYAIQKGGFTSEGIKKELYKISNYQGISGITSFDINGDVMKPAMIKQVKNGQFLPLANIK